MGQKQHVDIFRKFQLRRVLLKHAGAGAVYVPFIGDGDIATELYMERQMIWGADIDGTRTSTARERLPGANIITADCDAWPFASTKTPPFAVADFDAYCYPYTSFRAFWGEAPKAKRLVLFFTDGERMGIKRIGHWRHPDGTKGPQLDLKARRPIYNMYMQKVIVPWFRAAIRPYRIIRKMNYLRKDMCYWGSVIER